MFIFQKNVSRHVHDKFHSHRSFIMTLNFDVFVAPQFLDYLFRRSSLLRVDRHWNDRRNSPRCGYCRTKHSTSNITIRIFFSFHCPSEPRQISSITQSFSIHFLSRVCNFFSRLSPRASNFTQVDLFLSHFRRIDWPFDPHASRWLRIRTQNLLIQNESICFFFLPKTA